MRHVLPGLGPSARIATCRPADITLDFDSGPLAGLMHATTTIDVRK